jgi:cytochrome c biogenesis protein CcdA
VIDVDLALAFTTGMVATVNPCGFAMLPAYLSFFLGVERERAGIGRAIVVGVAVTVGFAATFAVAGLVVSRVTNSVYDVAPWVSLVIGGALVLLGLALLAGFDATVRLPRLERGGRSGALGSMMLFGVSSAVASVGCELPLFLAAMSGVFGRNLASGIVYFVVFGLGFATIIVSLTIAMSMARQSIVHTMRRVLPFVNRIAGGLLVLAGAYVAWYGWVEIRDDPNDATVARVTGWSDTTSEWIRGNWTEITIVLVAAIVCGAIYILTTRRVTGARRG